VRLARLPGRYAVARAAPDSAVPEGLFSGTGLVSVTRTAEELSVVAAEAAVAGLDRVEGGWTAFRVAGTLDFALTGVLADLSGALAGAGISLFAVSTYDTDYILVREADADRAGVAWRAAGHDLA